MKKIGNVKVNKDFWEVMYDKYIITKVCNECNVKLKHYRFLAPESKLKEMPKFK